MAGRSGSDRDGGRHRFRAWRDASFRSAVRNRALGGSHNRDVAVRVDRGDLLLRDKSGFAASAHARFFGLVCGSGGGPGDSARAAGSLWLPYRAGRAAAYPITGLAAAEQLPARPRTTLWGSPAWR